MSAIERGHLEDDSFWNAKPVKADQSTGDVFRSPRVEDEPGCNSLNGLQMLDDISTERIGQTMVIDTECFTGSSINSLLVDLAISSLVSFLVFFIIMHMNFCLRDIVA